jgi:hypothetical protein
VCSSDLVLASQTVVPGLQSLTAPDFMLDLALKIVTKPATTARKARSVATGAPRALFTVAGDPFTKIMHIDFFNRSNPVDLEILDLRGKCVAKARQMHEKVFLWDTNGTPAGLYLIRAQSRERAQAGRIAVLQ